MPLTESVGTFFALASPSQYALRCRTSRRVQLQGAIRVSVRTCVAQAVVILTSLNSVSGTGLGMQTRLNRTSFVT
jgi:hypothetical protein